MNKISRLSKLNIDSILDLQSKSFSDDLWDDKDQLLKYLEWPIAHGMFENEILKGLIFGYHHSHGIFHIYSIEVFPEYQKQKIGQELLQNVIDYCINSDYDKIQAYAVSDGGFNLLSKFGFIEFGEKEVGDHITKIMILNVKNKSWVK